VDGRIEALAQTFRRFDRVNRHFREVDRHQNISKLSFFMPLASPPPESREISSLGASSLPSSH
jgi:hypothetical protein